MKSPKFKNNFKFELILIIILSVIALILNHIICSNFYSVAEEQITYDNSTKIYSLKNDINILVNEFKDLAPTVELIEETNDYVYAQDYLNCRLTPDINGEVVYVLDINQEIYRFGKVNEQWSKVLVDNIECYVVTEYISTEKKHIETSTISSTKYPPEHLKTMGVIYDGGYRYTWYSERVLPGGGLNIPGRHSDGNFVRDENNYLCVASNDLSYGTVIETPWGTAKVYDSGCASGTIDIYVSW